MIRQGVIGSEEGHAIGELRYWISWGDYDLAEAAYRVEYRQLAYPNVRFVRSWGLLNWALVKKKGFDRVVAALREIHPQEDSFHQHVMALVK